MRTNYKLSSIMFIILAGAGCSSVQASSGNNSGTPVGPTNQTGGSNAFYVDCTEGV